MKTPYAIVIGLALIAAAIFFREPSVPPAQAGIMGDVDGFRCPRTDGPREHCFILHGDKITRTKYWSGDYSRWYEPDTTTWR
jgi:hypothetical protein